MKLSSRVFTVKALPQESARETLPKWWARAVHACFLGAVQAKDAALAEKMHASSALRPFTVSSLFSYSARRGLRDDELYSFRITSLNDELSDALKNVASARFAPGSKIELDHLSFEVVEAEATSFRFDLLAENSYERISAPYLSAKKSPPRKIFFEFFSPITFKSGGLHQPIPLPAQLFGSLLNRWNAFAPITFPEEVRRYAEECLAMSRFSLSSRVLYFKEGAMRVGSVGKVSYKAVHYDPYWMSIIALLADYAFFSGAGSGINFGMGQLRRIFQFSDVKNARI